MKTINYAIDLGTTNSLIARFDESKISLFNNPLGLKQTLPSCVAFRGNRTVIGDKAVEYLERDAQNVCMLFKRKMGSEETYFIPALNKEVTPIELSSLILKELQNFVPDTNEIAAAVITIPASFDTVQSNATKKAGYLAGFKEVVLLQEPIAACLAYANTKNSITTKPQKWMVYDFGGGTFDVALVEVSDRELKVIDNQGDNFLGGADLDTLLVEHILIPFLEEKWAVKDLWKEIKSKNTAYKGLYFELLQKAEEAKKELSLVEETEIELDIHSNGKTIDAYLDVSREQFEALIEEKVQKSIDIIKNVLSQNQLIAADIEHVILIGGTTYIPMIRSKITAETGIAVDASVNATSAVVEGAAYYAGSKPMTINIPEKTVEPHSPIDTQLPTLFYEQNTRDLEELISGTITSTAIQHYRLMRVDGGYDSGIKQAVNNQLSEFVPLLEGKLNRFKLQLLDANLTVLNTVDTIAINQGAYNVHGQPLPNDICVEVDDLDAASTRLERVFSKGSILPLKKKLYKTASKTLLKDSEATIVINIIEGKANGLPSSGLSIGYIEILGKELESDLIKGTDIEIEIEITESRDVKVSAYLQVCDQEFENVFSQSERAISVSKINQEINTILDEVDKQISISNYEENFEFSKTLETIRVGLIEAQIDASILEVDDVSDAKYQLDDKKRKLIQQFDELTRTKIIANELEAYNTAKEHMEYLLMRNDNEHFRNKYAAIIKNEKEIINSVDKYLIQAKIKEIDDLYDTIIHSADENFISYYINLKLIDDFTNKSKAKKLIEQGDKALETKDYKTLRYVVYNLTGLLPNSYMKEKKQFKDDSKTGLS